MWFRCPCTAIWGLWFECGSGVHVLLSGDWFKYGSGVHVLQSGDCGSGVHVLLSGDCGLSMVQVSMYCYQGTVV